MTQVKGKFITLTLGLMSPYRKAFTQADAVVLRQTGSHWNELDPEGWYDVQIFGEAMELYARASITGDKALITLGREIYPTIKQTSGLPAHLKTPLEFILYEAEGYLANTRGEGVKPRRFIHSREGDVLVEAPAPGYNPKLFIGVFLGILEMCGVQTGKVIQTKAERNGDGTDEFHITW